MTIPSSNMAAILKKVGMTSISPKRMTFFMILALTLLGGIGWIMIVEKEEYLVQRNFRLLKLWSQDIGSKIESYQQVFKFSAKGLLEDLHSYSVITELTDREERSRFLRTHTPTGKLKDHSSETKEHSDFLEKLSPWLCSQKQGATSTLKLDDKQTRLIQGLEQQLVGICRTEGLTKVILSIPTTATPEDTKAPTTEGLKATSKDTEEFQLSIIHYQNPLIIRLTYSTAIKVDDSKENIQLIGDIELGHFFKHLTDEPIFDEVFLFESSDDNKNVQPLIFHSGSEEFSWTDFQAIIDRFSPATSFLGSLLGNPQDSSQLKESFIKNNSPNQFLIDVPGKTNNVFTLPVILPTNKGTAWRLVGLIDHDSFQDSYLAISSSLLLGIMFLILGLVLAIPLFHLKTMGATDPLRVTHVLTVVLAAFLGTGLFTVLILDIAIYGDGTFTLRQRMESSAQAIKDNVHRELNNILFTLDHFNKTSLLHDDFAEISKETENLKVGQRPVLLEVLEDQANPRNGITRLCKTLPENNRQHCYPDFLVAFWMDQDGSLRINWAEEQDLGITTNLSLEGREYVKRVLENQKNPDSLWQISDKSTSANYQFFLEPIISWTTGINSVVASMPSLLGTPQQPWVAAMEFKFLSLMDHVVLPPGIGLAVVSNDTHQVLFHSKERRNLREAFLVETDQNPKLRDLFAAKTAGHADGSYWGQPTSFYTLPLDPLPWALVVYRDKEILRSVNLFGLLMTGGIYGLWSLIVYVIAGFLLLLAPGNRKAPWMWPNPSDHRHYANLINNNLVFFFVGLVGIWLLSGQPGWQLFTGLVFIPGSCLLGAVFLVKKIPLQKKTSWFTFPNSYAYLATSFLLVFSVIPALSCFTSVFHKEMTLLTQYQLLETFKTLEGSGKQTLKKIAFKPGCEAPPPKTNEASSWESGFYPDFFLKTTWTECDNTNRPVPPETKIFDQLFAVISQPFLPLLKNVPLFWGFLGESWPSSNTTNQRTIHWEKNKGQVTAFFRENHTLVSAPLPLRPWFLTGNVDDFHTPTFGNLPMYLFLLILAGLYLLWLFKIPKFIATRTMFLGYPIPHKIPTNTLFGSANQDSPSINRLILGFPGQGKTPLAHQYNKEQRIHLKKTNVPVRALYFDLKTSPPEQWKNVLSNEISSLHLQDHHSLHVTIDHLDQQWKDPEINCQKLEFLGWLLTRSNHKTATPDTTSPPDQESSQSFKLGDLMIKVLTKFLSPKKS